MRWAHTDPSRMPDMHTASRAWEAAWERDFEEFYGPGRARRLSDICPPVFAQLVAGSNESPMLYEQQRRVLCRSQEEFLRNIAGAFAELGFLHAWRDLSQARREDIILAGIIRAFDTCMFMDLRRGWCPDSSLKHLAAQDGEVYIKILQDLLPSDVGVPLMEPLSVPCLVVDELFGLAKDAQADAEYRILAVQFNTMRQECMTRILSSILFEFYACPLPTRHVVPKKPNMKTTRTLAALAPFVPEYIQYILEERAKLGGRAACEKILTRSCFSCGALECDLPPDRPLRGCPKCRKVERKVTYCSTECQKADWKHGTPVPHKILCGKEWSYQHTLEYVARKKPDQVASAPWIPAAEEGFKRSPALLHQITFLKDTPNVDYVLMNANRPEIKLQVGCVYRECKFSLLLYRNRAFRTGSRDAVVELLHMLCMYLADNDVKDIAPWMVTKQLEAEYGVSLSDVPIGNVSPYPAREPRSIRATVTSEECTLVELALRECTILEN